MKLWQYLVNDARKFLVALVSAGAILGAALVDDHVSKGEWVFIVIAFLGALGVHATSNNPS